MIADFVVELVSLVETLLASIVDAITTFVAALGID